MQNYGEFKMVLHCKKRKPSVFIDVFGVGARNPMMVAKCKPDHLVRTPIKMVASYFT